MLISEDRIRGRRLLLSNGKLVIQSIKPLDPDVVAQVSAALLAFDGEVKPERKPRKAKADAA
jgi:hypothetical protein